MKKRVWSFIIIGIALLSSSYAVARAQAAQLSTIGDPVPGGMCGCMSCNCYFPDGLRATETLRARMSVYIDPRSLTASLESIHDAREDAIIKAQTPSTQTATKSTPLSSGSTVVKTSNTTSGTSKTTTSSSGTTVKNSSGSPDDRSSTQSLVSGSSNSSSNSSKPSNTNSSASKVTGTQTSLVSSGTSKNSSGSPDDRDAAKSSTGGSASTPAKNSSGSPDDRDEKKSSATGKSNGTYPYDSATGKEKTGSNVRADFMQSLGDTANWVAPTIEKASYDPKRTVVVPVSKPQTVEHGMGDNVKTLTPITTKDPWDNFYSGFYKTDPATGQRMVNVAPGPTLTKPQTDIKKETYYGPYYDKTNTKYWLDSKGDRVTDDPAKKKSTTN